MVRPVVQPVVQPAEPVRTSTCSANGSRQRRRSNAPSG